MLTHVLAVQHTICNTCAERAHPILLYIKEPTLALALAVCYVGMACACQPLMTSYWSGASDIGSEEDACTNTGVDTPMQGGGGRMSCAGSKSMIWQCTQTSSPQINPTPSQMLIKNAHFDFQFLHGHNAANVSATTSLLRTPILEIDCSLYSESNPQPQVLGAGVQMQAGSHDRQLGQLPHPTCSAVTP